MIRETGLLTARAGLAPRGSHTGGAQGVRQTRGSAVSGRSWLARRAGGLERARSPGAGRGTAGRARRASSIDGTSRIYTARDPGRTGCASAASGTYRARSALITSGGCLASVARRTRGGATLRGGSARDRLPSVAGRPSRLSTEGNALGRVCRLGANALRMCQR